VWRAIESSYGELRETSGTHEIGKTSQRDSGTEVRRERQVKKQWHTMVDSPSSDKLEKDSQVFLVVTPNNLPKPLGKEEGRWKVEGRWRVGEVEGGGWGRGGEGRKVEGEGGEVELGRGGKVEGRGGEGMFAQQGVNLSFNITTTCAFDEQTSQLVIDS
jgi:hypothetical protein